jgi:hypothetical protein
MDGSYQQRQMSDKRRRGYLSIAFDESLERCRRLPRTGPDA